MYTGGTATGAYQLGVQHVGLNNTPTGRPKKRSIFLRILVDIDCGKDVKSRFN